MKGRRLASADISGALPLAHLSGTFQNRLHFAFYSPTIAACGLTNATLRTVWRDPAEVPMALTRRQKEVLDFLVSFINRKGYAPSFEEIGRSLDLSSLATVHKHVENL